MKLRIREELEFFLDSPRVAVHAIDVETADFYATILDNLRAAGTPIPTNDIWIAAVSFQHGYQLLTKDQHFQLVPGLVHFQVLTVFQFLNSHIHYLTNFHQRILNKE